MDYVNMYYFFQIEIVNMIIIKNQDDSNDNMRFPAGNKNIRIWYTLTEFRINEHKKLTINISKNKSNP